MHACERTREMCDMPQEVVVKQRGLKSVFNPVFFLIITFTPSLSSTLSFCLSLPHPNPKHTLWAALVGMATAATYISIYMQKERERERQRGSQEKAEEEIQNISIALHINVVGVGNKCASIYHIIGSGQGNSPTIHCVLHEVWAVTRSETEFLFTSGLLLVQKRVMDAL